MKIHNIPLVIDHSHYKKIYTQIELTYQAKSVLEDTSFQKNYNEVLLRNAKIRGDELPIFDIEEETEEEDSAEVKNYKKSGQNLDEVKS